MKKIKHFGAKKIIDPLPLGGGGRRVCPPGSASAQYVKGCCCWFQGRACRKKAVNYDEAKFDKVVKDAVKDYNSMYTIKAVKMHGV